MITWSYSLSGVDSGSSSVIPGGSSNPSAGSTISDLALDLLTGDLEFPPRLIYGAEAIAQRIRVRFKWFFEEWFLDQRQGIPYYRDILIKNPDPVLISFIFRRALLTTPGVVSVSKFNASLNKSTRHLTVNFEATLSDNGILTADAEPFILGSTNA